ncbi:MAG: divalent metal cation transporter [Gammaproteobacteria bacterium]|nr:divalent metal cation transporter [Gammaproteobacteria bacterium]
MRKWLGRLGPGMMLAAVAIGVSHLVQSTRAGADYGLSFAWLIALIVVLKYPAFRFAADYATATGESLVNGYARHSRLALAWLAVAFFVDMFIASAAVSLVTAGLFISIFDLPFSGPQVAVALTVLSAALLLNGQYQKAERIVRVLVVLFSILSVLAMLLALPLLGSDGRDLFAEVTPDRATAVFVIAVAGWMPMPMTGAIFQSMWICERRRANPAEFGRKQALLDLDVGYGLALVLALCFVVLGTAVMFQTDRVVPQNAGAFATELLSIFTSVIGNWSYPVIATAAIAVMWSTLLALLDALPRVSDQLVGVFTSREPDAPSRYTLFLAAQVIGVSVLLLFLMRGFTAYIDFATSAAFIAAPALAYYNYRTMLAENVAAEYRPGRALVIWNWISIVALAIFALGFLALRII